MKQSERQRLRERRKKRVKVRVQKNTERPRLTVFKSLNHIYAQIIDDREGKTLASASTLTPVFKEKMKTGSNVEAAKLVGSLIGEQASQKGIKEVYYDRNGFKYTGRIRALADAVREKGVQF